MSMKFDSQFTYILHKNVKVYYIFVIMTAISNEKTMFSSSCVFKQFIEWEFKQHKF